MTILAIELKVMEHQMKTLQCMVLLKKQIKKEQHNYSPNGKILQVMIKI